MARRRNASAHAGRYQPLPVTPPAFSARRRHFEGREVFATDAVLQLGVQTDERTYVIFVPFQRDFLRRNDMNDNDPKFAEDLLRGADAIAIF
jgi:hypothetical protein